MFFAKGDSLRFLSHHDLMRAFHRALRRAGLPVRRTKGFNPRPRVVFPHALPLGIPSDGEVVEIELEGWVPVREFARRLSEALPGGAVGSTTLPRGRGLTLGEVRLLPPRRKGSTAVEAVYEARLAGPDAARAAGGIARFLESDSWKIKRARPDTASSGQRRGPGRAASSPPRPARGSQERPPAPRTGQSRSPGGARRGPGDRRGPQWGETREIDLRPSVAELALEGDRLVMRLRLGQPGAARPREVLAAILDRPGDPMFEVELRKTRTVLAT